MEQLSMATVERTIDESVKAHPSNSSPVFRGASKPGLPLSSESGVGAVEKPFGALVVGLANGVSVRHGIDALRISDTGGEVDANMTRSEVFNQAKRVEAPETVPIMKSPELMRKRRESYLEFLGMKEEEITDSKELLNLFVLDEATGEDGIEHVLFGDTRYEDMRGEGLLIAEGLHFLPAAKKVGLDVAFLKDYTRKGADATQRRRGVKVARLNIEGVEKATPTSMFPESYPDTGEEVGILNLLYGIKYALENAQEVRPSSVKEGNLLHEFENDDSDSDIPSMRVVTNSQGKIISAFPIRK